MYITQTVSLCVTKMVRYTYKPFLISAYCIGWFYSKQELQLQVFLLEGKLFHLVILTTSFIRFECHSTLHIKKQTSIRFFLLFLFQLRFMGLAMRPCLFMMLKVQQICPFVSAHLERKPYWYWLRGGQITALLCYKLVLLR